MITDSQILQLAHQWLIEGQRVAIALVANTKGHSPRPLGSIMMVREDGRTAGSVSGGCVEAAVIEKAQECLTSHRPAYLEFGSQPDNVFSVGLACGGSIEVVIAPLEQHIAQSLVEATTSRSPAYLVTTLPEGHQAVHDSKQRCAPTDELGILLREKRFRRAQQLTLQDRRYLVQPFPSSRRLFIVGGVHIAQALAPIAQACDYQVTIIEPRSALQDSIRFPGCDLICGWPSKALAHLDEHCAVVALTHDAKFDDPSLHAAIASDAFYIGALGSQRTHKQRLARLLASGLSPESLARIHGPVGLPIGAQSPGEIAVSIMAEITQKREP